MQTKFPTNHKINGLVTAPLNVNNHKLIFIPFFLSSVFQEQNDMTDIIHNAMLGKEKRKKRPAERSPSPGPQKRKPYSLRSHNPGIRPTTENGDVIIVIDDESPKKKRKTKSKRKNGPPNHSLKKDSETLHIVDSVMPQHSKSETPARDIILGTIIYNISNAICCFPE